MTNLKRFGALFLAATAIWAFGFLWPVGANERRNGHDGSNDELQHQLDELRTDFGKLQVNHKQLADALALLAKTNPPIGAIIPFVGNAAAIPPGWQLCDGKPLNDPTSPLKGVLKDGNVPNLTDRFVRGTSSPNQLQAIGGKDSHDATHSHPIDLDTKYGWREDNKPIRPNPASDPRSKNAYLTNGVFAAGNTDVARPKIEGRTGGESLTVPTVPPYYQTYFIIKIK